MKNSYWLYIAFFSFCIAFTACDEEKSSDKPTVSTPPKVVTPRVPQRITPTTSRTTEETTSTTTTPTVRRPSVTDPISVVPTTPAQNAKGVYHYVCGEGCSGGFGAPGNCPTCGTTLLHNSDYHN